MYDHLTKTKGDLGVFHVQLDLCKKGYLVCLPLTEHAPFDLVGYKDESFIRVQVKFREVTSKGNLEIPLSKYQGDRDVDIIAIYCPDTDLCYYVNPSEFNKSCTLRVKPSKNNQKTKVNLAEDFLDIKVRCRD